MVVAVCDYCGKEIKIQYKQYLMRIKKHEGKYFCKECFSQSKEAQQKKQEKTKRTCLKKYSAENPMQVKEFQDKMRSSLGDNVPTSKPQLEIYKTLKNNFNEVILNYPVGLLSLDCAVFFNGIKIDVEYDGWYWHQDQQKDIKRDKFLQSLGFKVFRIKGCNTAPTEDVLKTGLNQLFNSDLNYFEYQLEEYKKIIKKKENIDS